MTQVSVTATWSSVVLVAGRSAAGDGSTKTPYPTPSRGTGDTSSPSPSHGGAGPGGGRGVPYVSGVCGPGAGLGKGENRTCMPVHLGKLLCAAKAEVGDDRSTVGVSGRFLWEGGVGGEETIFWPCFFFFSVLCFGLNFFFFRDLSLCFVCVLGCCN